MLPLERDLPDPPNGLAFEDVSLEFVKLIPAFPEQELVPYYHFKVVNNHGLEVGHISLRIGDNEHITVYVGHIGYTILPRFRGNHYAYKACRALAPFAVTLFCQVIITCNPDNWPSIKTIEKLGAVYLGTVKVPPHDRAYQGGARVKRRYEWNLKEPVDKPQELAQH
ncbi:MAG: GNAT family N-acetyltransferase [Fimbriimonadaceae bacterium]